MPLDLSAGDNAPFLDFLRDHPEWTDEFKTVQLPEGPTLIGTGNAMRAFTNWSYANGKVQSREAGPKLFKMLDEAERRHKRKR